MTATLVQQSPPPLPMGVGGADGTVPISAKSCHSPWSTGTMLPRATLTWSIALAPCAASVTAERQSGNGSASGASQVIREIWLVSGLLLTGSTSTLPDRSRSETPVSRTLQGLRKSPPSGPPADGPAISSNISTVPTVSASRWPDSVAVVAPAGRQHCESPQV